MGFFGLGNGYLIYGPRELLGYPQKSVRSDRALGVWGVWMPGLCLAADSRTGAASPRVPCGPGWIGEAMARG
jgi:hypothetical protein